MKILLKISVDSVDPLSKNMGALSLRDKLFLKMIAEYIYCSFVMGHLGSIIPPVQYRISSSAVKCLRNRRPL